MGQKYEGTLIIQTNDNYSPTGEYRLESIPDLASEEDILKGKKAYGAQGVVLNGSYVAPEKDPEPEPEPEPAA
jgi:hypothetical protein